MKMEIPRKVNSHLALYLLWVYLHSNIFTGETKGLLFSYQSSFLAPCCTGESTLGRA